MFDAPGDQARFFYLALLGMVVAVSVFGMYRGRLGAALQHTAIWGLIFAGLVIAYGFKDQLWDGLTEPDMRALSADAVALRRRGDGRFHATLQINGRDVPFLVDTGATSMVLSRGAAERVGFRTDDLSFVVPADTANGRIFSAPVTLESVRLGPFSDAGVEAMVNGGDLGISLLGMRYLNRFARVSIEGDRLILER